MPRSSPEDQRQRILDAARAVFAGDGFAGARVDDIAERAGLNKRLLYHYVGHKAELLRAVLEREARALVSPRDAIGERDFWRLLLEEQTHLADGPLGAALGELLSGSPAVGLDEIALAMLDSLLPDLVESVAGVEAAVMPAQGAAPSRADTAAPSGRSPAKPRVRLLPQVGRRSASKRSK